MEKYQIIIVAIVMFLPIILISSTLHHIRVSKEKVIKQKFEIISLIFTFLFEILLLGLAIVLFFSGLIFLNIICKQKNDFWTLPFLAIFGIMALLLSYFFLKSSVYFFRHLYFESSRNVYFEKETGKLIVDKSNVGNSIDLNSANVKIVRYITPLTNKLLLTWGKTEVYDEEQIIIISDLLNLTPELEEKIINGNSKVIRKRYNWI